MEYNGQLMVYALARGSAFFPKAPPEMGSRLDFGVQGLARDLLWSREAFPGKL